MSGKLQMKWYYGLEAIVNENVRLADYTWYRLGGAARYFCTPTSTEQVCEVVRRANSHKLPLKVLGGGANILVRDEGFDGVVLRLCRDVFGTTTRCGVTLRAGGAADLPDVVRRTVNDNLGGLEYLAGIPGTIGGAVRMNAGGKFGEIGQSVQSVNFVDRNGVFDQWDRSQLQFNYRKTNLTDKIIMEVVFDLSAADPQELRARYTTIWNYKKLSQPFTRNNAGCMFKNPTGHHAGELIDRAGLKGESCGGAIICERHANFIVTHSNTTASDVLTLINRVRQRVLDRFEVDLELEVDVW